MRAWLAGKREGPLRRRDALLGLPLVSIAAVMACMVLDLSFGWSVLWNVIAGLAICAYVVLERCWPRR